MKPADKQLLVALTGSIASGKSLAAAWFKANNYQVISTDQIGHDMLKKDQVKLILHNRYDDKVFVNEEIDRKKLGKIIFSDPSEENFSTILFIR